MKILPLLFTSMKLNKIAFFFFVMAVSSQAQNISGRTTSDGLPLPYVNIFIKNTTKGSSSNDDGLFSISNVPEGTYTIVASFTGFKNVEKQVVLDENLSQTTKRTYSSKSNW